MLDIKRIFRSDRIMKALTGVSRKEFDELLSKFEAEREAKRFSEKATQKRKRAPGAGRKHTLAEIADQLFFILFYVKTYPSFDVAGAIFGVHAAQACRWVSHFLPILEAALGRRNVLPKRQLQSQEDFHEAFPEVAALFMDGTERPTQRAADYEIQKQNYSGKKKRHTKKNLVINDERKRVLILTKTQPGKAHDYTLFKQSELGHYLPEDEPLWVDTGFQGIEGDYPHLDVIIPFKKPKGKELSPLKKLFNRAVARGRVLSENTIAGIKRLKSVTDIYRNRRPNMEDRLMLVACGLWNLHVEMSYESER